MSFDTASPWCHYWTAFSLILRVHNWHWSESVRNGAVLCCFSWAVFCKDFLQMARSKVLLGSVTRSLWSMSANQLRTTSSTSVCTKLSMILRTKESLIYCKKLFWKIWTKNPWLIFCNRETWYTILSPQ